MNRTDGGTLFAHLRQILCAGTLADAPDEELLAQFVARRDEAAFAALMRRHGPMVWGVCGRLLPRSQDAEDAFQATFLLLASKAASIDRPRLLANWLFGVARRSALRMRAQQARRARQERSGGDLADAPSAPQAPWDDAPAVVNEELARMPAKYRLPLLLCGLEGLTHAEAGKSLGWPTGTVATRLWRGRELLRTRLLRRGVTAPTAVLTAVLAPAAGLPSRVAAAVPRAAAAVAAGQAAAAGVSPHVALLMRRVLRTMLLVRWLTATSLLAALAVTLCGAGLVWQLTRTAPTPPHAPVALAPEPPHPGPGARPGRAGPTAGGRPAPRLPNDPDAVVVRMQRTVDADEGPAMALTIRADGRVVAEIPEGLLSLAAQDLTKVALGGVAGANPGAGPEPPPARVLEGRLSAGELEDLLRFALYDQKFFDIDPAAVGAAIRERHQCDSNVCDVTDATTTTFRIRTADRTHEVRWPRLAKAVWDFPDVERLLQLYALDRRLQHVFYVLVAGGPERVEAVAAKMNELAQPCYQLYPGAPRLTAADLVGVAPYGDGSRTQYTFSRSEDRTITSSRFEVSILVPQQGESAVYYVIPPQTPRQRLRGSGPDGS
jgi:RNA polymerase sigma factor (sigma-70 family)